MKEETITTKLVEHLETNGWDVISFDFPQSGTGTLLKKNGVVKEKNKHSITPDIIALKSDVLLFMENKSWFSKKDVEKLLAVRRDDYSDDLPRHFPNLKFKKITIGVGLSDTENNSNKLKKEGGELDLHILLGKDGFRVVKGSL